MTLEHLAFDLLARIDLHASRTTGATDTASVTVSMIVELQFSGRGCIAKASQIAIEIVIVEIKSRKIEVVDLFRNLSVRYTEMWTIIVKKKKKYEVGILSESLLDLIHDIRPARTRACCFCPDTVFSSLSKGQFQTE